MAKKKKKRIAKKMRPGGGSAKGSQFERDRCVQFSQWWTEGKREDVFWRTAGSGARATTRRKVGKATCDQDGDMTCIDPVGKPLIDTFCFEFKSYKTYDMLGVMQPVDANHDWMQFWAKCYDDALSVAKRPFLVTKRNRGHILGWITSATKAEFEMLGYRPWPRMILGISERIVTVKRRKVHLPDHSVVGFHLDSFLEVVDPRALEEFYGGPASNESSGLRESSGSDAGEGTGADREAGEDAGGSCGEAE